MKARVKYNNEIIDIVQVGTKTHLFDLNNVEFLDNPQDYWTRLEHQYAGMAMQAMIEDGKNFIYLDGSTRYEHLTDTSMAIAYALVEKLKEKEEK
jgi:hypothetical protein